MKELTPEQKKLLDDALVGASFGETMLAMAWCLFCPSKIDKLIEGLEKGLSWRFAYDEANKVPKPSPEIYKEENSIKTNPQSPTEKQLCDLHEFAQKYCYTSQDGTPTISRKGIELLLIEYNKNK